MCTEDNTVHIAVEECTTVKEELCTEDNTVHIAVVEGSSVKEEVQEETEDPLDVSILPS